jgi:putative membrane protein
MSGAAAGHPGGSPLPEARPHLRAGHPLRILEESPALGMGLFGIFYGVGVVGHLLDATRPLMLRITPFFLPLMGLLALSTLVAVSLRGETRGAGRFWAWAGATLVATWALEVLGVHTGIVFGDYVYGRGLGAPLLGVPPIIGANWVLVCLGMLLWVTPTLEARRVPALAIALVAAALATAFDWVMEPVAITLGYWSWGGGDIPLQNYLAWFLIALGASWSWLRLVPPAMRQASRLPAWHVVAQLAFVALLRLGLVGG